MKRDLGSEELGLRLWRQMYQTYTLLKQCEDRIFGEHGLTTEQYGVLVSIEYLGDPARMTDIGRWLERSTNSVSMIVDRMVKAGLVRRARDRRDRRVVFVNKTSKAESLFTPATAASLELIQKILLPMSHGNRLTLLDLLGEVKYETLKCINPEVDIQNVKRDELKQAANIEKWLARYRRPGARKVGRQGGKKSNSNKKAR
jgi:DNA-binding MarR family transcriptional regulator